MTDNLRYLRSALRGAQNGNGIAMVKGLRDYRQNNGDVAVSGVEKRLYTILAKNLEVNIRTRILLGLGTAENPRYNSNDLVQAVADIKTLLEVKSGIKLDDPEYLANHWSDFLEGLPKDETEDGFEKQCRAGQS